MELRPYCEADLAELVSLLNGANRESRYEFIPYTEEKLRAKLEEASSILLATDEQGRIMGLARLRREWFGEEVMLCARPGPERREIEALLLSTIEREAQTGRVVTLVDAEDQGRLAFFSSRGYRPESCFYQMVAELDRPQPLPPVPRDYFLRSLKPEEEEALIRLVNAAYRRERLEPGALARWRAEDPAFSEEWIQVAESEGELVAVVVARSDREFNEHYHANRGYLGPAATLPVHQGKGLGKALTARAMNFLHAQGMQAVCLYTWEGNPAALRVTRSLGFRVGHRWKILVKSTEADR